MTEIEKKALALLNERHSPYEYAPDDHPVRVLARAIEQHEAFRQEVSDAVAAFVAGDSGAIENVSWHKAHLSRFIIPKPDPLVEVLQDWGECEYGPVEANALLAVLAKRGGKIVWEDA